MGKLQENKTRRKFTLLDNNKKKKDRIMRSIYLKQYNCRNIITGILQTTTHKLQLEYNKKLLWPLKIPFCTNPILLHLSK